MQVQPYLFYNGRSEEAIAFYQQALGAKLGMLMRFKDSPEPPQMQVADTNKVMHASMTIGDTMVLLSDGGCQGESNFQGFALSLTPADSAEAERLFGALSEGGEVRMPLMKTFFSPSFGMVSDRFGVMWMVYVPEHG